MVVVGRCVRVALAAAFDVAVAGRTHLEGQSCGAMVVVPDVGALLISALFHFAAMELARKGYLGSKAIGLLCLFWLAGLWLAGLAGLTCLVGPAGLINPMSRPRQGPG